MVDGLTVIYIARNTEDIKAIDITDVVESFTIDTTLNAQPGRLNLSVVSEGIEYELGAMIQIKQSGEGIFLGYIFETSFSHLSSINIVAYDQSRYLKNQDTIVLPQMTTTELFRKICEQYELKTGVIDESTYKCPAIVQDTKTLFDMLNESISMTLANERQFFVIRDEFGKLELRNIYNLHSGILIDEESTITSYDFTASIDKETYNSIKIVGDAKKTEERSTSIKEDEESMQRWGTLRFTKNMEGTTQKSTMEQIASALLARYNRISQTLTLHCLGDFSVKAGSGVAVSLAGLDITDAAVVFDEKKSKEQNGFVFEKIIKSFLVKSCTHSIQNSMHTMKLELCLESFN